MSWLEDAQRGNECLPCWHPLKSGGRGKLFQLGAQLRPCPFGAPPTGTGLSRPKLELCSHAVVLLPFHPWEWYITTNQAKRRANPCEPALSVAIATGYRELRKEPSSNEKIYNLKTTLQSNSRALGKSSSQGTWGGQEVQDI